jgi:acetyl esterase/lipase
MMDIAPPDADARLPYGQHASQFVDFRRPAVPALSPLVIMIHGGFWRHRRTLTYAGHTCIALSRNGYATANIEYRRTGEDGGGWPGTFEDVKSAITYARERAPEFGGDPKRTILLGHSAGGHLALLAAAHFTDLLGAISLGGVVNLRRAQELGLGENVVTEFMNGTPAELPQPYRDADPVNQSCTVTRVLIHGELDDIVPVELSREFPQPRRYVEIPQGDHYMLINPDCNAFQVVLSELTALT